MNEIINKLDDFLAEREDKEKYMIYGSIIIVFIIIYYYFNYMNLYKKIQYKQHSLEKVKKSYDISSYSQKLKLKRKKYFVLSKNIKDAKTNLNKINKLIVTVKNPKLIVDKKEIFEYLRDVFKFSISKYVFPSYEINESNDGVKQFTIFFKGEIYPDNFKNVVTFLRYMENNNFISSVKSFEFNIAVTGNNKISDFNGTFNIWSYK